LSKRQRRMFDTVLNKCTTFCKAQPQSSVKTQTFSNIILTSASLRCFFVWYGFASSASKLGSPAPTQCQSTVSAHQLVVMYVYLMANWHWSLALRHITESNKQIFCDYELWQPWWPVYQWLLTLNNINSRLQMPTANLAITLNCKEDQSLHIYYAPDHRERGNKHCFCPSIRPSVCLSVVYIANNSRMQRPSMPKFWRNVPHLRCDSHTSFKVKWSMVRVGGSRGHTMSAKSGRHTACLTQLQAFQLLHKTVVKHSRHDVLVTSHTAQQTQRAGNKPHWTELNV